MKSVCFNSFRDSTMMWLWMNKIKRILPKCILQVAPHRTAKKKNGWQMAMTHWCTNVHTISVTTWNMSNSLGNSSIRSIRTIHVWWRILYMEFPIEENLKDRNREAYENQIHRIFHFFYPKYTQMVFVQYFVHHYAVFYEIFASDCVYLPIYMNIEQHTAFGRHGHWTVNTL